MQIPEEYGDEKRDASRYTVIRPTVYVGWWEGPEFITCAAVLRNLSASGALVTVAAPVQGNGLEPLWLCLGGSSPGDWAESSIVSVAKTHDGLYLLRLRFVGVCPYEMFKGAVREFGAVL